MKTMITTRLSLTLAVVVQVQNWSSAVCSAAPADKPTRLQQLRKDCEEGLSKKEYQRVIEIAATALSADSTNAAFYAFRGKAYAGQLKYESALQDFQRYAELAPSHSDAHFLCAESLFGLAKLDESLTAINKAIELD